MQGVSNCTVALPMDMVKITTATGYNKCYYIVIVITSHDVLYIKLCIWPG